MRLPKWLDRERRIHTLSVQLDAKHQELLAALGQIGKLAYEKGEALMDLDSTRILLDRQRKVDTYLGSEAERQVLEAIEESDMQRARYRYAWLSARRRAERHGLSARAWRSRAEDAERQRKKAAAEHEETIRMLLRQHEYIRTLDPPVALALADLLDSYVWTLENTETPLASLFQAIAVARAVLREPGDTP